MGKILSALVLITASSEERGTRPSDLGRSGLNIPGVGALDRTEDVSTVAG